MAQNREASQRRRANSPTARINWNLPQLQTAPNRDIRKGWKSIQLPLFTKLAQTQGNTSTTRRKKKKKQADYPRGLGWGRRKASLYVQGALLQCQGCSQIGCIQELELLCSRGPQRAWVLTTGPTHPGIIQQRATALLGNMMLVQGSKQNKNNNKKLVTCSILRAQSFI